MDKVNAMKEETDQRMIDLFKATIKGGTLKQLGGYIGIIDKVLNRETTELELEIEYTE